MFGWTWEYLHKQIPWAIVHRMLIDASRYKYKPSSTKDDGVKTNPKTGKKILTDDDIIAMVNQINGK